MVDIGPMPQWRESRCWCREPGWLIAGRERLCEAGHIYTEPAEASFAVPLFIDIPVMDRGDLFAQTLTELAERQIRQGPQAAILLPPG